MGFFTSKEKVGSQKLLDMIVLTTITSWNESQKAYKLLLKDAGESETIDNRQKTELLIFEMLAMTIVIKKVFDSELMLDAFHNMISEKVSSFEWNKEFFKKTLVERYAVYQNILNEGGSFLVFSMGKQFADYFLEKDCMAMALINFSGENFFTEVNNNSEFFQGFINKYEIGK